MNKKKKEQLTMKQALELLGKEMKVKFPPGSKIVFNSSCNKGEEVKTVSCSWYDKVGGPYPLKNIVSKVPEWQNIPYGEAQKIAEMFDDSLFLGIVYV